MNYVTSPQGSTHSREDLCSKSGTGMEILLRPENSKYKYVIHHLQLGHSVVLAIYSWVPAWFLLAFITYICSISSQSIECIAKRKKP